MEEAGCCLVRIAGGCLPFPPSMWNSNAGATGTQCVAGSRGTSANAALANLSCFLKLPSDLREGFARACSREVGCPRSRRSAQNQSLGYWLLLGSHPQVLWYLLLFPDIFCSFKSNENTDLAIPSLSSNTQGSISACWWLPQMPSYVLNSSF